MSELEFESFVQQLDVYSLDAVDGTIKQTTKSSTYTYDTASKWTQGTHTNTTGTNIRLELTTGNLTGNWISNANAIDVVANEIYFQTKWLSSIPTGATVVVSVGISDDSSTLPVSYEVISSGDYKRIEFNDNVTKKYIFYKIELTAPDEANKPFVADFEIKFINDKYLLGENTKFLTQLSANDYIKIFDISGTTVIKQISNIVSDTELNVTEYFATNITAGSSLFKVYLDEIKNNPIGVHLPDNTLSVFYLNSGDMYLTQTTTPFGVWDNRTFTDPNIASWDENIELLMCKYLSGAYAWLTWHLVDDKKDRVALYPTPDKYRFDPIRRPNLYLAKPNRQIIGILNNAYNVNLSQKLGGVNELTFNIPYEIEVNNSLMRDFNTDSIKTYFLIKLGYENTYQGDWFIIDSIEEAQNEQDEKLVTCYCLSHKLSDFIIKSYLAESVTPQQVLDEVLDMTPWRTGMISTEYQKKYRTYEVGSKTVLDFLLTDIAETLDCFVIFDSEEQRVNLIHPDKVGAYIGANFSYGQYLRGIGKNLNVEEFCTHFSPYGMDELTINETNPTGQHYLFDYSYFMYPFERDSNKNIIKSSFYMSDELCNAILDYQALLDTKDGNKIIAGNLTTSKTVYYSNHGLVVGDYILNKTRNSEYRKVTNVIDSSSFEIKTDIAGQIAGDELYTYKDGTFRKLLFRKWDLQDEITELETQIYNLDNEKTQILNSLAVYQERYSNEDDEDIKQYYSNTIDALFDDLTVVQSQINTAQTALDALIDPQPEIDALKIELSMASNFTSAQLKELKHYIKEQEWSNENIFDPIDLYDEAIKAFSEVNQPKIDFNVDIVNFVECLDDEFNKNKLVLGDKVKIQQDTLKIDTSARIIEIDYDFETLDIQIGLANSKNIMSPENKVVKMFEKSLDTTSTLNNSKTSWNSIVSTFNQRSNRIAIKPATPTLTDIGHEVNKDGSVNIYFTWDFNGVDSSYVIDGFTGYLHGLNSNLVYTFGSNIAQDYPVQITKDKRSCKILGVPATSYYWIGIQAYRNVDTDINSSGILKSDISQNNVAYLPEVNLPVSITYSDVGAMPVLTGTSLPTPSSTYRGLYFTLLGSAGVADQQYICLKQIDETYIWQPV